jgi:hypothetical protein
MKIDPLQQYAKLKQQLLQERDQLEARLNEIKQVLGEEIGPGPSPAPAQGFEQTPSRRGRRPAAGNTMSLKEAVIRALSNGPVPRKDLVRAVEGVGYRFTTKNPLNSIGSILYGKNSAVKNKGGTFYIDGAANLASTNNGNHTETASSRPRRKKRTMSPEARERIAAAQRARWARQKRKQ